MKENNEVMNANTKENIKEVQEAIKKVAEKKTNTFQRGDAVVWNNTTYTVVEVIAEDRWHFKNVNAPFNSCIVTAEDLVVEKKEHDPDLLVREDKRFSL